METFAVDPRAQKVNLGVGIYYDEDGKIPVLESVRAARKHALSAETPSSYLPIEGDKSYRALVADLLFGDDAEALADSLAIVQSVGGSGALKVGADFLRNHFPTSKVYVSDPTWDNHLGIFEGAGFTVGRYRYYSARTKGLDFQAMLSDLETLKPHDIVLLHACCHNPSGVDPTCEQWIEILEIIERRRLIAFVDIAYQGFGEALDLDAFVVRELARRNQNFLVSHSFSKIFSLYGERCGTLTVHCSDPSHSANVFGQLQFAIRRNYSSPPTHGMNLITHILSNASLRYQWFRELEAMRSRIVTMRETLNSALTTIAPHRDHSYVVKQRGMFAYTGLTPEQVSRLRDEFAIYAVSTGRICVAGLNHSNIERVAYAIDKVTK
jgi:aromatic-amino-acid transaminase